MALAACGGSDPVWAPDEIVNAAVYRSTGERSLTLYTMRNVGSGSGAHSSLLVDASQRVMFDPAGTFGHATIPERNDVLFGMNPRVEDYYVSYHARSSFFVEGQRITVSSTVAERALRLVMSNGAVAKAACTKATSAILQQLPGFESIDRTYFPNKLRDDFAKIPSVVLTEYRENDADDKSIAAAEIDAAIRAGR